MRSYHSLVAAFPVDILAPGKPVIAKNNPTLVDITCTKAKGEGLSLLLDHFDVSLAPDEPAALLETRPDRSEARHWSLVALDVDLPYKAALAVRDQGFQTLIWNFPA
jgi:hypothetical protein